MNPFTLKNLYPNLQPWERIRLLLSAQERQDDVEYQRLFNASKIRTWYFSEHLLAEQALHVLTLTFITEQLDAAACLFLGLTQLALHDHKNQEWEQMAECSAYFFSLNAQGWKAFCSAHQFPAETLVARNQSGWVLSCCEQYIPTLAPTLEELKPLHAGPWLTVPEIAARWQSRLLDMIASTPLDTAGNVAADQSVTLMQKD